MLSIMAVAGGRGRGLWRRRREFLMGSLNGKVFTLPAVATAATALHDSTYVFLRIRVHSTCYKCHAHTHSPYTHTHSETHAVATRRHEDVVVSATDQKFQVFEWKRETSHCCQGKCWPASPPPPPATLLLLPWQLGSVSAALIEMFRQRVPFKL